MTTPVALAGGTDWLIDQLVTDRKVRLSEGVGQVILTASVRSGPNPPISQALAMATNVAVQMDFQVAMQLHAKLGALGRSVGWLPPTPDGNPS